MKFNINDEVIIKLTKEGKNELIKQAIKFRKRHPVVKYKYKLPFEDNNGYSKWQFHSLLHHFGHMLVATMTPPFEPEIIIKINTSRSRSKKRN